MNALKKSRVWVAMFALFFNSTLFAGGADIRYQRGNDSSISCVGTCLSTNGIHDVVATVAHCLDNLTTGGVMIGDASSTQVFVAKSVIRNPVDPNDSSYRDDDFALLVFPKGVCRTTADRQPRGATSRSDGSGNPLPSCETHKNGTSYQVTIKPFSDVPSDNVVLNTDNTPRFIRSDSVSGTGLYNFQGEYVGSLIGCNRRNACGYLGAHDSDNRVIKEVFEKARASGVYSGR